jgi:predicted ATPase
VLLVDEVEVSLYVGALSTIVSFAIEAAKRLDVQLFLSTHDLDVVDAFIDRAGTEDTLHILRLARPGAKTRFHNIDHARARTLRDDIGIDLRRAG